MAKTSHELKREYSGGGFSVSDGSIAADRSATAHRTKIEALENELQMRRRELSALTRSTHAVLQQEGFESVARAIFDHCCDLIGATSGYVALLSEDGRENEVLFLEAGGLPCDVNPELPMPIRGLRADAYRENRVVYHNDFMHSRWVKYLPRGHVRLNNVLFAPLVIDGRTVGIMGIANKPAGFNERDAVMAGNFGELAAIALRNSRQRDKRKEAERSRERTIVELQQALATVKKLSGMLPICAKCKNIRNDQGYWTRIEEYIETYSEAELSHSLCPECLQMLYPDLDLSRC